MKYTINICCAFLALGCWILHSATRDAHAQFNEQFVLTWVDIGELHSRYSEGGGVPERYNRNRGLEWPAILRRSGHYRAKGYWIGVKDWVDTFGQNWEYQVAMIGPTTTDDGIFTPVETKLVAKFEDTRVLVDGLPAKKNLAQVDEIDPDLPADRMLYQRYRSMLGIDTERWVYAYAHDMHDDYHIIRRRMTNTGNVDADPEIELNGQALHEVRFFNAYRWVGREEAAWHHGGAQVWGKYNMVDIVGDGHQEYPVDFTAIYSWAGYDPAFPTGRWNPLGSPMARELGREAPGDTIGRLAGMSMQGRVVLHADESVSDTTYNPDNQPSTLAWVSSDGLNFGYEVLSDYYEVVIRSWENPDIVPGGSSRMYPHYADRIEPEGEFWNARNDAGNGDAGGKAASIAYGPYNMAFGEAIEIVEAEGAAGLSYRAATEIGIAYKSSGFDDDLRIPFDADGDGFIADIPWNYDVYKNGSERQTKNQWVMTARDSMFQFMYKARDVWEASNEMRRYPLVEPPRPPRLFEISSRPDRIHLFWETMAGISDPEAWELYRTSDYVDKLPYERVATLPGSARNFDDLELIRGVDYYYFLQAVGPVNSIDDRGLNGTPGGAPLKSGRYFTQAFQPARLTRRPGPGVSDFRIVPNPINLAADETIRTFVGGDPTRSEVEFLDIPGNCTITIYSETGEFIKRIHHADGSGLERWDLTSSARQKIVSGIYLVRVTDNDSGTTDTKKMVVIF